MTGLLQQAQQPNQAPEQGAEVEEVQATPEEQAIADKYLKAALGEVLGNGQAFKAMMKSLEASRNNPVDGIARIAITLYEKAERKLGPLDDDDISEGVAEGIIEALLDMAQDAGVVDPNEVDADVAQGIYLKMTQLWIEQNPDRADPDDVAYLQSQKGGA